MNRDWRSAIAEELSRLESLNYVGLLGVKYLSSSVTTPDTDGNRVVAVNLNPAEGWAVAVWGPTGEEQKHRFLRDVEQGWVHDGLEELETIH